MKIEGLEKIGEAADKLATILKETVGILIEPAKKIMNAKADMHIDLEKIRHEFNRQKVTIVERAKLRVFETEIRRQYNLEAICYEAVQQLPTEANPENINEDWLHHFISSAQDVSEEELRKIWSNILCQEATKSGQFSKRTLDTLKNFSVSDAAMFEVLSQYLILFNYGYQYLPNYKNSEGKNYYEYFNLIHLSSIGLIEIIQGLSWKLSSRIILPVDYFGTLFHAQSIADMNNSMSYYPLTRVGNELMKVVNRREDKKYSENLRTYFINSGFKIIEVDELKKLMNNQTATV